MGELIFRADDHTYWMDGRLVPNVTMVLQPLVDYSHIPPEQLEIARQKGIAVHKMIELHCRGDLDEDTLPAWMQSVLPKWIAFQRDSGFRVSRSEYRIYHPAYCFAGTLDLYGELVRAGEFAFIDAKRSFFAGPVTGIQVAAYREGYAAQERDKAARRARRFGLRINEREPVLFQEYRDDGQWFEFLALLTAHKIKEKYHGSS